MTDLEELRAIDALATRLRAKYPETEPDEVRRLVVQVHHQYDGSRIRDFVPVLVEREVSDDLRARRTAPPPAATA
jgi:hypothetical protein